VEYSELTEKIIGAAMKVHSAICVDTLLPIHKAQLLTYLRLANKPVGLLLNFKVVHMREGVQRILTNKYQMAAAMGHPG
jgi:hypothetical protein